MTWFGLLLCTIGIAGGIAWCTRTVSAAYDLRRRAERSTVAPDEVWAWIGRGAMLASPWAFLILLGGFGLGEYWGSDLVFAAAMAAVAAAFVWLDLWIVARRWKLI